MRGKRLPEEIKIEIASRLSKGEDAEILAGEYKVSEYTIKEWGRLYKPKRATKKKVTVQENTRVSDAETKGLREENQRLRNLLLDEILRNRGS